MNGLAYYLQRNSRLCYYLRQISGLLVPPAIYRGHVAAHLRRWAECHSGTLAERLGYYNRIRSSFALPAEARPFRLNLTAGRSVYQLDLREGTRYFDPALRLAWQFGDITTVPPVPTLVKSRPIGPGNANAVLFNLNRVRHFVFVKDTLAFEQKEDRVVWRGRAAQAHRKEFLRRFHDHPRCDVGHYHKRHQDVPWQRPRLTMAQQLRYKFILAIEGNDVASSLKWILSSNSVCVMARPRFETWFMEGRLVPDRHFVEVRDDYSDLDEKLDYYLSHPAEARAITREANRWVDQFQNAEHERLLAIFVLWKYFHDSGQLSDPPPCEVRSA